MKNIAELTKAALSHWQEKRASRMGAAISYYAIFSIAPFFILLISLVSAIFDRATVLATVHHTLRGALGSNLTDVIQSLITSLQHAHTGIITTIIGIVVLFIGAISMFSELNTDLDELWYIAPKKVRVMTTAQAVRFYLKEELSVLFLMLLCGLLLLFSVAFTVFLSLIQDSFPLAEHIIQNAWLLSSINIFLTLLFTTVVFTLIYHILPQVKLPWSELIRGAFLTAILFLIGKFLIGWYIASFGATSAFGAAGSLVALLLWIYYSAQVFFIGASYTFVYSQKYGYLSRK
jgi:membrane protein